MEEKNSRTVALIGNEGMNKISKATIALFGLGGVGSFCVEALARSGVSNIILVDFDVVEESNFNRQLIAVKNNLKKKKTLATKERIHSINENINVICYDLFIDSKSISEIDFTDVNFIIDCIDSVEGKMAIIKKAKELDINIISSMGTANKMDPSKLRISDISKTEYCPLAKVIRKKCKEELINKVPVCYSIEQPIKINEAKKLGTMIFVPASAGLLIANYVISKIIS